MISNPERYNPPVIKIQDGTQVYLMDFNANVILEFCYISKPFLVGGAGMKVPVQIVLCDMCRIIVVPCTTLRLPLNR